MKSMILCIKYLKKNILKNLISKYAKVLIKN
jgi:hypothetical protein